MKEAILINPRPMLAALLTAALGACAIAEPPPDDRYYRLDVPLPTARFQAPALSGVLEVARMSADGLVGNRAVAYVVADQPHEVFDYNYHFWNQPPGELVQGQLIRFLRAANAADRVLSPELRIRADYAVEGRIRRFEQSFAEDVSMIIELELGLVRLVDQQLLLLRSYRTAQAASGDSVASSAVAANAALAAIFAEFAVDLERLRVGKLRAAAPNAAGCNAGRNRSCQARWNSMSKRWAAVATASPGSMAGWCSCPIPFPAIAYRRGSMVGAVTHGWGRF